MGLGIDYVSVYGLSRMLKSHVSSNLNNVQTGVRAVKFYCLLCELNEHPPDKQSPVLSQDMV